MESNNKRKAKALLFLPLLIIPFITLAFWALGGGKAATVKQTGANGLNVHLPDAHFKKDGIENKMSFYEDAERDSARYREETKKDPLFSRKDLRDTTSLPFEEPAVSQTGSSDPNERKVYQKLAELRRQLDQPSTVVEEAPFKVTVPATDTTEVQLPAGPVPEEPAKDPEVTQLNSMMEKILDIQHPERVAERLQKNSAAHRKEVFAVSVITGDPAITMLAKDTGNDNGYTHFYSDEDTETTNEKANAVEAEVCQQSPIVAGAPVKMRLLEPIYVAGTLIPKNHFVFGTAALNGERLVITVSNIRFQSSVFPVSLSVYDMDGMEGIYVPGSVTRTAGRQSGENALQQVGVSSVDPSVGMQAATAGIEAAKNIIGKKVRVTRVFVKTGYRVLLTGNHFQNH